MTKILIIEDETLVRESLSDLLQAENFELLEAENGMIGVGLATKHKPDLIICDILMPQLDGYGVLDKLRQQEVTSEIPFIFLTAKASHQDMRTGMNTGADDYLTKPFSRRELLDAVNSRLHKQEQSQRGLHKFSLYLGKSLPYEFITPLSSILGASELLTSYEVVQEDPHLTELGNQIYSNAKRLQRQLSNLLLFTQLELISVDSQKVAALRTSKGSSLVKATVEKLAVETAAHYERGSDLELALQEGEVPLDTETLQRILTELFDNAFKYSKPQTPVRLMSFVKQRKYVLYVIDSGCGMSPEQLADFGKYVEFEQRVFTQQGAGLGLMLAKRLLELYGGTVAVDSVLGQKTIIRLDFPLVGSS